MPRVMLNHIQTSIDDHSPLAAIRHALRFEVFD